MNQQTPLKAATQPPGCSQKTLTILAKIDRKAQKLKTYGLDAGDLEKLKKRLTFAWGPKARADTEVTSVTLWRGDSARKMYLSVQDAIGHLFLPFLLAVSPTDCSMPNFQQVLWHLRHDQKYVSYHLSLGPEGKKSLESIAIECCFIDSNRYLELMQSLFPPGAYSLAPLPLRLC
jgi:hypothetical protein